MVSWSVDASATDNLTKTLARNQLIRGLNVPDKRTLVGAHNRITQIELRQTDVRLPPLVLL
jgi:hypothetical protein